MIDVETSDQDIGRFLEQSLHKPLAGDTPECCEDPASYCFQGFCEQHASHQVVELWRKRFKWHLEHKNVKSGALLVFSSSSFSNTFCYVLGVVLKRPSLHMLLRVTVLEDEVQFELQNGVPVIQSEREVLLHLAGESIVAGGASNDISVEVWGLQAFFREGCQIYAVPVNSICSFNVADKLPWGRGAVRSKPLPFGLKLKTKTKGQPGKKNLQGRREVDRQKKGGKGRGRAARTVDLDSDEAAGANESSSSEDSTGLGKWRESERIVHADEVQAEEAKLSEVAKETEKLDELREQAATNIRLNKPVPGRTSSFFASELGLADGAIAVSGRSICLCCKLNIAKGSIRFSWFHSLYRPSGWIHATCVCEYVKQTGLRDIAMRRLAELSGNGSSSSRCAAVPPEVSAMASNLRQALLT